MSDRISIFEDFIAWQKARELTSLIYKATSSGNFAKDFGLRDQRRRAAVSIMSNIAEGFERGRPTEFKQFLSIAKAPVLNCALNFTWLWTPGIWTKNRSRNCLPWRRRPAVSSAGCV